MSNHVKSQTEKRKTLSSIFISILIGFAFQEMIFTLRQSILESGITFGSSLLAATFFFVAMRFFIGNQLHLQSKNLEEVSGFAWLYDLMVIIAQSVALIFLASLSSIKSSRETNFGFFEVLIFLYVIDIVWIISQWLLNKAFSNWRREFIPWAWAILNSVLVFFIVGTNLVMKQIYSDATLLVLLALNVVGFIVDVVLVDYYDMI